jgi:sugar lactone lactonase YvrE
VTRLAPVRWQPPKAPPRAKQRTGPEPFPRVDRIPLPGRGPEDVAVMDGLLYTGLEDGRVLRVDPGSRAVATVGDTGGRPLGLEPLPDGRLLVCDSHKGLLRLDPATGDIETLVTDVDGPLVFCSNAAVAADGTIYFTESSRRWGFERYRADLIEHSGTGRLFRYATDKRVEVVASGFDFANGLVLTDDDTQAVVAETGAYRLTKVDLATGAKTTLSDNLPGFPDNLGRGSGGLIWVALPNPRDPRLDALLPRAPWLRKVVWAVPERLQPQPTRTTWVVAVDETSGEIVRDLQAKTDGFAFATGVAEHDGRLYLGSISENAIAVLHLS